MSNCNTFLAKRYRSSYNAISYTKKASNNMAQKYTAARDFYDLL